MKLMIVAALLLFASHSRGQNIIGTWQANDTLLSSNLREHYVFSTGNKFAYNTSGYDGLQRILTIGGHYRIAGSVLFLTPEYTVENRTGTVERSHTTTLNDSWAIAEAPPKTYKIAKPVRQSVQFKLVKRRMGLCMLLDTRPYYKVNVPAN
jgi:hypothetical protein